METILEKLRKIDVLARSGVAGEKDTAQRLLVALCQKHGITPEQLTEEKKRWFTYKFKGALEKKLLNQCVAFVACTTKVANSPGKGAWSFELTALQGADVGECFEHYRKELAKQQETLLSALIAKHRLYTPSNPDKEDRKPLTDAERAEVNRIALMAFGLTSNRWEKSALTLTR